MPTHKLIAIILYGAALVDVGLGYLVIAPRVPEQVRPIVKGAFSAGAFVMAIVASLIWTGKIPIGA